MSTSKNYNKDKGFDMTEMLEPLHHCVREMIQRDRQQSSHLVEYTDDDIMAVALAFTHILSNRLIHNLNRNKVNLIYSTHLANNYAASVRQLTKAMTGVEMTNYYADKSNNK